MKHGAGSLLLLAALAATLAACTSDATRPTSGDAAGTGRRPVASDPPFCPSAPQGTVLTRSFPSTVTGGVEPLRIYVPPRFEHAAPGRLPLLVLLHGSTADETQWIDVGIATAADCLIASGEIEPMMIVTVDGRRVDATSAGEAPAMERFVAGEVLPYLRTRYPQLGGREVTSIGGISRGGGWALRIAADRPDLFSAAGGHSAAGDLSDEELRSLASHDVRLWLDVGRQDRLGPRVHRLAARVRSVGYGVLVMGWDGGHDRRYWSRHVEDYLRFYGRVW